MSFSLSGGTGDADLYARAGTKPTTNDYDCISWNDGTNNESCTITAIETGNYHVMINGYKAYDGTSLVARYTSANGRSIQMRAVQTQYQFTADNNKRKLKVEFSDYNIEAKLTLTLLKPDNSAVSSKTINLVSAPLLLSHHLLPAEQFWVVETGNNASMVNSLKQEIGDALTVITSNDANGDQWVQDEMEIGGSATSTGQRLDTVINSIRNRGLDSFVKGLAKSNTRVKTWGTEQANTFLSND